MLADSNDLLLFFFNPPATTEIYTLSLHDALPILGWSGLRSRPVWRILLYSAEDPPQRRGVVLVDRKSTRLNSSHVAISYAVFCLKKKNLCIELASPCLFLATAALFDTSHFLCLFC